MLLTILIWISGPVDPSFMNCRSNLTVQEAVSSRLRSRLVETIGDIQRGEPKLERMQPMLRVAVEEQKDRMQSYLSSLGSITSVDFVGPQNGAEVYRVRFANGTTIWSIAVAPDGRLSILYVQPVQ